MASREGLLNVSLPDSYIKSPGILMKDKKDPFEVRQNHKHIHNLLGFFKEKMESPFTSFANLQSEPSIPTTDRPLLTKDAKLIMEKFLKSLSLESPVSPGKLKTLSDKISNLTQKTKDILCVYGLELIVEDSRITKEVYNLFKALIPQICFFPCDFFQKLKITQLLIYKEEEPLLLRNVALSVVTLDTKQKVRQRLNKIIFDHLITANPEILRKWRDYDLGTSASSSGDVISKLEETFLSLMENLNNPLLKPETQKLRELLAIQYPEAMSEEKFKWLYKEKKRSYKVRFDTDP